MEKPFSPSCERNQHVLLEQLNDIISGHHKNLLEIGSGTGQHAVFMAPHFPHLLWHTSDVKSNHKGIKMWLKTSQCRNIRAPIVYESGKTAFPSIDIDVIFTVNTLHIMSWENVKTMIKQCGAHLKAGAEIVIYGPFNYHGRYTSTSNADFDQWLKEQNPESAIRDFEAVVQLMQDEAIDIIQDISMPANNHLLHFAKKHQ